MSSSVDISNNSIVTPFDIEKIDDSSIGYELARLISIESIVEGIEGKRDEDLEELIKGYLTKWISLISPIEYVPGMIEVIASKINKRLSKVIGEISEDDLGEVFSEVVRAKRGLEEKTLIENWTSLEVKIMRILRCLGVDLNEVNSFINVSDSLKRAYRLISIFVIAIGIASIWDEKWIAGYQ
ncbi:MAG: hypothetical protein QXV69_04720 [Sulfolobaceae archaeon]